MDVALTAVTLPRCTSTTSAPGLVRTVNRPCSTRDGNCRCGWALPVAAGGGDGAGVGVEDDAYATPPPIPATASTTVPPSSAIFVRLVMRPASRTDLKRG